MKMHAKNSMSTGPRLRAWAVAAAAALLCAALGTSARSQTLFSDDFQDGNADGWTKSGGTWAQKV